MDTAKKRTFSTPMMIQYMDIKNKYPDCLLFFRLGDFYELFLDDAIVGSKILDIVLTKRPRGKDGNIPMAGVPYHSAQNYITKLIKAGHKIAICEQVSEPNNKGIVDREVVRIITPGTVLEDASLNKKRSNFVMTLSYDLEKIGIAFLDLSTGKLHLTEDIHNNDPMLFIQEEIRRFSPAECILSPSQYADTNLLKSISKYEGINIFNFNQWDDYAQSAGEILKKYFKVENLHGFGLFEMLQAQKTASALIGYSEYTQRKNISHIKNIQFYNPSKFLKIDESTIKNLELYSSLHNTENSGTFISVIDETVTPMGGRLLKEWISKPLNNLDEINDRLSAVQILTKNVSLIEKVSETLSNVNDIERTLARLSVGIGNARDLNSLKKSLELLLDVKKLIPQNKGLFTKLINDIDTNKLSNLIDFINKSILDDPSVFVNQGNIFKYGVNKDLDHLRSLLSKESDWVNNFEKAERKRTGIQNLKVRFNKVFGFYIEISSANVSKAPKDYLRKQTMVNAERFITEELKEHEKEVLSSETKANVLEHKMFKEFTEKVLEYASVIQQASLSISIFDCINSFSISAIKNNYTMPKVTDSKELYIDQGRHPVVEQYVSKGEFVPNDTLLNSTDHQLVILTGPNMAGKSVYIRQVALIALMAHMGMFVPASKARIPLTDRIFVRSGASDSISSGLSTFMVEMTETANILNNATTDSLIIMDEVGRGTSTYDGISIASAIVEYLVKTKDKKAKTLFATHYHELQDLEEIYPKFVKNYQMKVVENNEDIILLHSVEKGRASHSYGVSVARKAGIPTEVIKSAMTKLNSLEKNHKKDNTQKDELSSKIKSIDIESITPIEAFNLLSKLVNE